jgi:hypothetical protein
LAAPLGAVSPLYLAQLRTPHTIGPNNKNAKNIWTAFIAQTFRIINFRQRLV